MMIRLACVIAFVTLAVVISIRIDLSAGWARGFILGSGGMAMCAAVIFPLNLSEYVTTTKTYDTFVASKYVAQRDTGPILLTATIYPMAVPSSGSRHVPDCYIAVDNGGEQNIVFEVSKEDYGTLLEGDPVKVTYYYIGGEIYNVKLGAYSCANNIPLRDSNIFKQSELLRAALPVNYGMQEDTV